MAYQRLTGGWIEVVCGCMFSGKSEELIRRVRRTEIARQKVQVFCHALDQRYGDTSIFSHSGARVAAVRVPDSRALLDAVHEDTKVVAIDEVQFFDAAVCDVCNELAATGRRVIVAGLDMDFRGEPFGAIPGLLAQAELVDKLHAICMVCGASACRTQRLINGQPAFYSDPIIMVGASEVYEARCRMHHDVPRRDG